MIEGEHERFMRLALAEAATAQASGEVPVGAAIVLEGRVIGVGGNRPIGAIDPTDGGATGRAGRWRRRNVARAQLRPRLRQPSRSSRHRRGDNRPHPEVRRADDIIEVAKRRRIGGDDVDIDPSRSA